MKHKPYQDTSTMALVVPVVYIQAPPTPDERAFMSSILQATQTPFLRNDKLDKRQAQVINVLRHLNTKMLIVGRNSTCT